MLEIMAQRACCSCGPTLLWPRAVRQGYPAGMKRPNRRSLLISAGACAAVPLPTLAQPRNSRTWEARRPLPWSVQEIYCAVSHGEIVLGGGLRRAGGTTHIEDRTARYDPVADTWTEGPRLPAPRHHPMILADASGKVFAIGGYGRSEAGEWTSMTEVWALEDGGWREAGRLPAPLSETVGVELGGRLHLVSGRSPNGRNGRWEDQADVATHRVFVPAEGRWETAAPCPLARNSAAGAVLEGALWLAGGRTVDGGGTGQLDRYDPAADRWDTLAPIPFSAGSNAQVGGGLALVAVDGRLVALGGEWFAAGGGGVFRETWLYEPRRDAWERGPEMLTPRHGLAAAVVDGVIYAIAGGAVVSGGRATGTVEALRI
jgi:N-acetylneuraminic acid mutarotase